jgi:hypothetical protein
VVKHCVLSEVEADIYYYLCKPRVSKSETTEICTKKMNDVPLFQVGKYTLAMEN